MEELTCGFFCPGFYCRFDNGFRTLYCFYGFLCLFRRSANVAKYGGNTIEYLYKKRNIFYISIQNIIFSSVNLMDLFTLRLFSHHYLSKKFFSSLQIPRLFFFFLSARNLGVSVVFPRCLMSPFHPLQTKFSFFY